MIGIDTNVLVRYLTQDDKHQAEIAAKIINSYEKQQGALFISNIVLCELVWVLERGYKYDKKQISNAIRTILSTVEFAFEYPEILWLALADYERTATDFSDILIGKINHLYNCKYTITFDNKASNLKELQHLDNVLKD